MISPPQGHKSVRDDRFAIIQYIYCEFILFLTSILKTGK